MNRLFISTIESYIPLKPVTYAWYTKETPDKIQLYAEGENTNGYIKISSEHEGRWFVEAVFNTLDNKNNLIIDYTKMSITQSSKNLEELIGKETKIEFKTSIQTLELEEK